MGRNCAIAIGINHYYNLTPLKYAQHDAEALRNFCQVELQFDPVYFFAEGAPPISTTQGPGLRAEPTLGNLERFLRVRFEEKFLEAGDNLWFFFAGHGKRYQGRDYLMPIDGDPSNVERTAIAIRDISDRLRRSGADNIILMVDACRGEGSRDGGLGIGQEKQQGVVTFFSCSPNELSYEIEQLGHGSFTHALLEGLRLQGEGNCATVERLDQHLRHYVPRLNQQYRKPVQTPYAMVEPAAKYHLILLARSATVRDAEILKLEALKAEVLRDFVLADQFWVRVLAVSPADPDAIAAIRRLAIQGIQPPLLPSNQSEGGRLGLLPAPLFVDTPAPKSKVAGNRETVTYSVVTVDDRGQQIKPDNLQTDLLKADLGDGIFLDLVPIPGGSFQMGSPATEVGSSDDERPQHQVTVSGFWMGRFTVTQEQWKQVAAWPMINIDLNLDPSHFKGAKCPVESISWYEAIEFCARLSKHFGQEYRLPSEAEWEYACRAGTTTPFHFGPTITPELVNYDGNYPYGDAPKGEFRAKITDVGSFPPNALGLYDMHGNVWEWCADSWYDTYNGAPVNGSARVNNYESKRLLRGGSWDNLAVDCRCADRNRNTSVIRDNLIGFRVAVSFP